MARPSAGDLLVATPSLLDPNFDHTVVLLLDSDENGALGVVLNRPSPVPVAEVLPDWRDLVSEPDVLFSGGPVSRDSALAVAATSRSAEVPAVAGFRRLYGDVGIVDLDTPTDAFGGRISHLRVFAGYAGWGEEQLRDEIGSGAWHVVPSLPGDLFTAAADGLWRAVLRRQPGQLAWFSTQPIDPTQN